jgi:hypothetical protein
MITSPSPALPTEVGLLAKRSTLSPLVAVDETGCRILRLPEFVAMLITPEE